MFCVDNPYLELYGTYGVLRCQVSVNMYMYTRSKQFKLNVHFTILFLEGIRAEAEFVDVIGTKVVRVFLLAIQSHLY